MQRRHNTEIWDMDWFINLPHVYKLFYLWAKDHAEQCGIWRPKISAFRRNIVENTIVTLKEFLHLVNKNDEPDDDSVRVLVLDNGNWLFTEVFIQELGRRFNPHLGAHRSAFRAMVINKIELTKIEGFDWYGIETLSYQQLKEIANAKVTDRQSVDDVFLTHRFRGMRNEERGKSISNSTNSNTTTKAEIFSKKPSEEEKVAAFAEMFKRVCRWDGEKIFNEVGRFINKYPDVEPKEAGPLINSWVANDGKINDQKITDHGKVSRSGAKAGLQYDKP